MEFNGRLIDMWNGLFYLIIAINKTLSYAFVMPYLEEFLLRDIK